MSKKIVFTNVPQMKVAEEYFPSPASKYLPEWYKKTNSYYNDKKMPQQITIKKCIPVFDVLSMGYYILLARDVFIENGKNGMPPVIHDAEPDFNKYSMITTHDFEQAPFHPYPKFYNKILKWTNPFSIKTEPGYSCYFTTPPHQDLPFLNFDGVVDTDRYHSPVNIPFSIDTDFEGLIEAGTPIIHVIPFKRDSFKMEMGSEKELNLQKKQEIRLHSKIFDRYKTMFWIKKEYK